MVSIIVIEDDPDVRQALQTGLSQRGDTVRVAASGIAGIEALLAGPPDVVLLDLGLPDVDGVTVIGMIRAASTVPIIVVSGTDDAATMVHALDGGADDYIVKPVRLDQVTARIRAVIRRTENPTRLDPIRVGELLVHAPTRTATIAGHELQLARREFDLLLALAERAGEVVSKATLLSEVWDGTQSASGRTVDVHLSWLRRKLGESAAAPRYLRSVRGVGVKLVDPSHDGA